ncbi:MAG: MFS transporter [Promethearchaeota archaeon]
MKSYKRILYLLLFGLIFLRFSISFLIITSFPKLQDDFDLNNFHLGTIISIYFLTSAVFIFIWIYLFGKYSKYKVFLVSSFIWTIGSILFSFSQNYVQILICSAIIGIGIESSAIIILLILFQISPKEDQGKMLSIFIGIQGAGSIFGVFLTAYVEDILSLSWNFVFLFIGILSFLWVCLSGIMLLKYKKIKIEIEPYLNQIGYNLNFKKFREIIKKKTNLSLIILFCYSMPFIFFFNLWLQKYFQDYHSLSQMEAAISYIFLTGGEFLGMIFGGFLYDKFYSRENYNKIYITIIGLAISIPLFFIGFFLFWEKNIHISDDNLISLSLELFNFAISDSIVFLSYIMLFLGFFSFALIYPFVLIVINDCNTENEKGTMLGMESLIEITGQAISPIIGGLIADFFSILIVMLLIPFFLVIPLIHLILMRKTIEKDFLSINKR